MKVWLLYPYTTSRKSNAFGWFREAFTSRGMELEVYFWGTPGVPKSALISENGDEMVLDRHHMPDAVLIRGYNSGLSMWFEMRGKKVINRCKSMEWSRDKVATARLLEAAGLPTPRTLTYIPIIPSYEVLKRDFRGQPFVMKLTFGSKGEDVYLIDSQEQYMSALAAAAQTRERRLAQYLAGGGAWTGDGAWRGEVEHGCAPLFQEYIPQSRGRDLRVWVVGGKVAGHVLRHSSTSFKSNFAQGGDVSACALPREAAALAIAATKCLGLDFAGVDLLFQDDCAESSLCQDFTVCEVNGNAGFRTSSIVGSWDIPGSLAELLR